MKNYSRKVNRKVVRYRTPSCFLARATLKIAQKRVVRQK